jgi:hypothetical protein
MCAAAQPAAMHALHEAICQLHESTAHLTSITPRQSVLSNAANRVRTTSVEIFLVSTEIQPTQFQPITTII